MLSQIQKWEDFDFVLEETEPGETYTDFAYCDENGALYYGKAHVRRDDLSVEQAVAMLRPIADSEIFSKFPCSADSEGVRIYRAGESGAVDGTLYIKRPKLTNYSLFKENNVAHLIGKELLDEALAMEVLSRHPHPNIIKYHGCCNRDGYLTSIVLDHYACTIKQHISQGSNTLDIDAFMAKLQSAIQHIHDLGWAHNDLNPGNVLIDNSNEGGVIPILIDFGSAKKIGEPLGTSRGTHGWFEGPIENYTTSKAEHDIFALGKIHDWLRSSSSS